MAAIGMNQEDLEEQKELPFPVMLLALVERRRVLMGFMAVGLAWGVVTALLKPTHYSVYASFMPSPKRGAMSTGASSLGGLAAQLGIGGVSDQGSQGAYYFADVIRSRTILEPVVLHQYVVRRNGVNVSGQLPKMLEIDADSAIGEEKAIAKLLLMVSTTVNPRTGVVTVKTSAEAPDLALQITQQLLTVLEAFNTASRQAQAASERQFIEKRVSDMLDELHGAESALQFFVTHNRDIRGSPALQVASDRLSREVQLRQQVYGVLVSAYEQARIDQLRDTPLLTIVESPAMPAQKDPGGRLMLVLGHTVLLLMIGAIYVLYRTARQRAGLLSGPEWDELRKAARSAIGRQPRA